MSYARTYRNLKADMRSGSPEIFGGFLRAVDMIRRVDVDHELVQSIKDAPHPLVEGRMPVLTEPLMVTDGEGTVIMLPGPSFDCVGYFVYVDAAELDSGLFMLGKVKHAKARRSGMLAFILSQPKYALRDRLRGWMPEEFADEVTSSVEKVVQHEPVTYAERVQAESFLNDFKNSVDEAVHQVVGAIRLGRLSLDIRDLDTEPGTAPPIDIDMPEVLINNPNPPKA